MYSTPTSTLRMQPLWKLKEATDVSKQLRISESVELTKVYPEVTGLGPVTVTSSGVVWAVCFSNYSAESICL